MSLDDNKIYDVHHYKTSKEMWDTLEFIYKVSPSIERKKMNTRGKENTDANDRCLSIFRNIKDFVG